MASKKTTVTRTSTISPTQSGATKVTRGGATKVSQPSPRVASQTPVKTPTRTATTTTQKTVKTTATPSSAPKSVTKKTVTVNRTVPTGGSTSVATTTTQYDPTAVSAPIVMRSETPSRLSSRRSSRSTVLATESGLESVGTIEPSSRTSLSRITSDEPSMSRRSVSRVSTVSPTGSRLSDRTLTPVASRVSFADDAGFDIDPIPETFVDSGSSRLVEPSLRSPLRPASPVLMSPVRSRSPSPSRVPTRYPTMRTPSVVEESFVTETPDEEVFTTVRTVKSPSLTSRSPTRQVTLVEEIAIPRAETGSFEEIIETLEDAGLTYSESIIGPDESPYVRALTDTGAPVIISLPQSYLPEIENAEHLSTVITTEVVPSIKTAVVESAVNSIVHEPAPEVIGYASELDDVLCITNVDSTTFSQCKASESYGHLSGDPIAQPIIAYETVQREPEIIASIVAEEKKRTQSNLIIDGKETCRNLASGSRNVHGLTVSFLKEFDARMNFVTGEIRNLLLFRNNLIRRRVPSNDPRFTTIRDNLSYYNMLLNRLLAHVLAIRNNVLKLNEIYSDLSVTLDAVRAEIRRPGPIPYL